MRAELNHEYLYRHTIHLTGDTWLVSNRDGNQVRVCCEVVKELIGEEPDPLVIYTFDLVARNVNGKKKKT